MDIYFMAQGAQQAQQGVSIALPTQGQLVFGGSAGLAMCHRDTRAMSTRATARLLPSGDHQ